MQGERPCDLVKDTYPCSPELPNADIITAKIRLRAHAHMKLGSIVGSESDRDRFGNDHL